MSTTPLEIGADGVDVQQVVAEIRKTVEAKREQGAYHDARIAVAERRNLMNVKDDEAFIDFFLECLRDAVFVDINDFEIRERRPILGGALKTFKKVIWGLLKFYTYRLWSQQNEINGLLMTAVESVDDKYGKRVAALERELAALRANPPSDRES